MSPTETSQHVAGRMGMIQGGKYPIQYATRWISACWAPFEHAGGRLYDALRASGAHLAMPAIRHLVNSRILCGGGAFALYGIWVALARVPGATASGIWWQSVCWALVLFTGLGALLCLAIGLVAFGLSGFGRSARWGAATETALLTPLIGWLLLNEVVYATTFEVLGPESLALVWNNPRETFQNAWAMGSQYLIGVTLALAAAAGLIHRLACRSYRLMSSSRQSAPARPGFQAARSRMAGWRPSLATAVLVAVILLGWQLSTRPSKALTTVFRSAPPFRALNLMRTIVGVDLHGPTPTSFGEPIISPEQYQSRIPDVGGARPNIVLIILESVPARALHCYGYPREDITPNMDALAREGILFEHCQSAASFSAYGVVSIMTSLYMLRGPRYDYFNDTSFPYLGLTQALKLAGYQLNLFSSGNETFDNIDRFAPPEDFDVYFSHDPNDHSKPDCMRMDDRFAGEAFEAWIAQRRDPRPFYCGFYLQSTHFNYEVPEPWSSYYQPVPPMYSNGDGIIRIPLDVLPKLRNQYDNAMRYSDYWVGRIRAALEKAGQWDNTLVVIIGDHGEAFMEHGLARHGVHTWEEMIHVPLIVHAGPTLRAKSPRLSPRSVPDTVSSIDVTPTIAALAGLPAHPSWQGVDVSSPGYSSKERPVYSMLQLTRWQEVVTLDKIKYTYDLSEVQEMMFDLAADPMERHDLIESRPRLAAIMKRLLGAWHTHQLEYYARRPFTHYIGRVAPTPADLEQFRRVRSAVGAEPL